MTRAKRGYVRCYDVLRAPDVGVCLGPETYYVYVMQGSIYATSLYLLGLCIYDGSRGQTQTLSVTAGFLAIFSIVYFSLCVSYLVVAIMLSSTIALVLDEMD